MNEKEQILILITEKPKHFAKMIKNNTQLYEWVIQKSLIDVELNLWPAIIYSAVHQESNICKHGNKRLFDSITRGFRIGCGKAGVCECVRESVSKNVSATKQSFTQEHNDAINQKRAETNLRERGVENAGQTPEAKAAHKAFYDDPDKVKENVDKCKATKLKNHGNANYNNIDQIKATLAEIHDAEYWAKKTGNNNYHVLYNKEELTDYINNFSIAELSEMFNISKKTIICHAHELDIQLPKKKRTKAVIVYEPIEYTNTDQLSNKYTKWYYNIMEHGRVDRDVYTETHHIIPECFYKNRTRKGPPGWLDGDPNDSSNLVKLTAREHFISHWLLTKMYEGQARVKMINAFMMMQGNGTNQERYHTKITARAYEHIREEFSKNISKSNTGRKLTAEQIQKAINAKKGKKRKPFSEEYKKKISENNSGKGNPMFGKKHSEETKAKISEKARGRKRERKECPHCGKNVAVNILAQFHGDNCKDKPIS